MNQENDKLKAEIESLKQSIKEKFDYDETIQALLQLGQIAGV